MGYKKEYSKTQEQDCNIIKENQLEIMNGKLCQAVLRCKSYDNPKKECNSMQKSVKKSIRSSVTLGLITSARLKMSRNVDRFLNKRRLENATW